MYSSDPQRRLVTPADLEVACSDPQLREYVPAFQKLIIWIEAFICQPHPELGREGSVCPYVNTSREKGFFWLTAYGGAHPTIEEVMAVTNTYREWFAALEPRAGADAQYKTILLLFPDVQERDAPDIIDQAHLLLKPTFVEHGLMIGQFHAQSDESGAWNQAFHPLRSPIPLLVIRQMASHDILFLSKEERYARAYLKAYGHRVPKGLKGRAQEAARHYGIAYPHDTSADEKEASHGLEVKEP